MRTQPYARRIGNAHAAGHDVVGHAGNLVHAANFQRLPRGAQLPAQGIHLIHRARPHGRPRHVGQHAEQAIQVRIMRADQAMAEQMQPKIGVMRIGGRFIQRSNGGAHGNNIHLAPRVANQGRGHMFAQRRAGFFRRKVARAGSGRTLGQRRARIPGVKHGAIGGKRSQAVGDGAGGSGRHDNLR
ncbi:hypothetical protein D3C72_1450120 [compost metagenome]